MIAKLKNEPVVVALIARLALYAGAKFGMNITVDDLFNVMLAIEAVTAAWTRMHSTPNTKVAAKVDAKVRESIAPVPVEYDGDLEQTPTGKP